MGDGWEAQFGCTRKCVAVLQGYKRIFNKASTRNWGTTQAPCTTLNLEPAEGAACKGMAFEFPDNLGVNVREHLSNREGRGFELEDLTICLQDGVEVVASVPVYHGRSLVHPVTAQAKAVMVMHATGKDGSCIDYVRKTAELLAKLDIDDPAVSELWQAVQDEYVRTVMDEIRGRIELLEANLPRRVDGFAISPHSKLPFKALLYREVLAWRIAELSRSAFEQLNEERLASAITLVRAALETSAALWYLLTRLDVALRAKATGDIDDYLMKLVMGSRNNLDLLPPAINVLNFIDCANKEINGLNGLWCEHSRAQQHNTGRSP